MWCVGEHSSVVVLDFTRVADEQNQETLCPAIDDIYLVRGHHMHDLAPLLGFTFRALNEFGLRIVSQSNNLTE